MKLKNKFKFTHPHSTDKQLHINPVSNNNNKKNGAVKNQTQTK